MTLFKKSVEELCIGQNGQRLPLIHSLSDSQRDSGISVSEFSDPPGVQLSNTGETAQQKFFCDFRSYRLDVDHLRGLRFVLPNIILNGDKFYPAPLRGNSRREGSMELRGTIIENHNCAVLVGDESFSMAAAEGAGSSPVSA
ncbi:Uncharacterised protein [Serratia fonticola]|uniref:Uncharacterized protein n=1 Tax=Serratia fonticola TaxID=47917 RepID=A0A4U9TG23_SERFO|nr:Uncharacterised protein [Serratia fonticola]